MENTLPAPKWASSSQRDLHNNNKAKDQCEECCHWVIKKFWFCACSWLSSFPAAVFACSVSFGGSAILWIWIWIRYGYGCGKNEQMDVAYPGRACLTRCSISFNSPAKCFSSWGLIGSGLGGATWETMASASEPVSKVPDSLCRILWGWRGRLPFCGDLTSLDLIRRGQLSSLLLFFGSGCTQGEVLGGDWACHVFSVRLIEWTSLFEASERNPVLEQFLWCSALKGFWAVHFGRLDRE